MKTQTVLPNGPARPRVTWVRRWLLAGAVVIGGTAIAIPLAGASNPAHATAVGHKARVGRAVPTVSPVPPPAPPAGHVPGTSGVSQGMSLDVLAAPSTVALSSGGPVVRGPAPVTVTATVASAVGPTGTVRFTDNGTVVPGCRDVALSSSWRFTARCVVTYHNVPNQVIVASYSGSLRAAASTSQPLTLTFHPGGKPRSSAALRSHSRPGGAVTR